jgi:hypothetical protein
VHEPPKTIIKSISCFKDYENANYNGGIDISTATWIITRYQIRMFVCKCSVNMKVLSETCSDLETYEPAGTGKATHGAHRHEDVW